MPRKTVSFLEGWSLINKALQRVHRIKTVALIAGCEESNLSHYYACRFRMPESKARRLRDWLKENKDFRLPYTSAQNRISW